MADPDQAGDTETKSKVLIVDDDRDMVRAVARFLAEAGYETIPASSPFEVNRLAYLHRPDVVVLDVMMPALDGEAVGGFIRRTPEIREVPIIFYSAMDESGLRRVAASVPNAIYVQKTDGLRALRDAVGKVIAEGTGR